MIETSDTTSPRRGSFRLGEFVVHPASNELAGPGSVVRLRPILMDLLIRLADEDGKPVAREALIADVWPRRMVNDEVLSRAVAELRTALGDSTRDPRYIETLPKVGYRMVTSARPLEANHASLEPAASAFPAAVEQPDSQETMPGSNRLRNRRSLILAGVVGLTAVTFAAAAWLLRGDGPVAVSGMGPAVSLQTQLASAANFTADVGQEQFPRFSPDGKTVAFTQTSNKDGTTISRAVLQDLATRNRVRIESGDAVLAGPVFHPDGKRLAYFRNPRGEGPCGIVMRNLSGTHEDLLVDCQQRPRVVFDLSPDGSSLVFSAPAAADLPAGLVLLDTNTRAQRRLTGGAPGEGQDTAPRFDRNGQRVAFMRGTDSHREVWMLEPANPMSARRIGPTEGQVYGLAWIDAKRLLVSADWHGSRALSVLYLDTGVAELAGARGARYPDVSRDGALVFETATYRADLWESDTRTPGRDARLLWPSTRYTNQAEYSPDGTRVVFASNRDGADHLYVAETGGQPQRLALTAGHRYIRPHWSLDGQRIFATRIEGGAGKLSYVAIVFDIAAGKEMPLASLGAAVADVREWNDSGALLIAENERHAFRLSVVDANGMRTRLALPLVSQFEVRAKRLAYALPQLAGLTICEIPALRCERREIPIGDENRFDWALDNDGVWYRGRNPDGRPHLAYQAFDATPARLFDAAPTASGSNIAISPSGKRMLVARESEPAIDLFLAPAPNRAP